MSLKFLDTTNAYAKFTEGLFCYLYNSNHHASIEKYLIITRKETEKENYSITR